MRRILGTAALLALVLHLGPGCASSGGGSAAEPAQAEQARKPQGVAPPADSPLAKIRLGMSDVDVRRTLGEPTGSNSYMTGKQFIPWYFGPDTTRTDYKYAGQGRVVFSRNQYSGELKVIRIDYDPAETGN